MRLRHNNKKFIFIANPKTGSESIRKLLNPFSCEKSISNKIVNGYYDHIPAKELQILFNNKNYNWDEYFKFGFIRNPYDKFVSAFIYCKPDKNYNPFYHKDYISYDDTITFPMWVKHFYLKKKLPSSIVNINRFFYNKTICLVDKIYKLEEMDLALEDINLNLNLNLKNIHINKTIHNHYSTYYDDKTIEYVGLLAAQDIKFGNYSFNSLLSKN